MMKPFVYLDLALSLVVILLARAVWNLRGRLDRLADELAAEARRRGAAEIAGSAIAQRRSDMGYNDSPSRPRVLGGPALQNPLAQEEAVPAITRENEGVRPPADPPSFAGSARQANLEIGRHAPPPHQNALQHSKTDEPFSIALAREIYTAWCRSGQRAWSTPNMEVAPLRYARAAAAGEFGAPEHHVLTDSVQPGEFVRFSPPDATEGFVYPNPDAHFSPVMSYLFAGLTRAAFQTSESLLLVEPVRVRRSGDSEWETI